jgi:outer membrane protein assembly factor BamB
MKPTVRFVALALVSVLTFVACTDRDDSPATTASTGEDGSDSATPTPAATFTGAPGTATYTYALDELTVTVEFDGSEGTMLVQNDTGVDLGAPDLYAFDAADGHEIDGQVISSSRVPAGSSATFDVSFDGIGVEDIGLLLLRFGSEDYGAFVRTG